MRTARVDADKSAHIAHLLGYIGRTVLRPLKIVVNADNGGAGMVIDELAPHLTFEFIRIHREPDGRFPHDIPNPLLPENRAATAEAVRAHAADFGIARDGDFDRCFFFDADGQFIEGYYLVGPLAVQLLSERPGSRIMHDPRLTWPSTWSRPLVACRRCARPIMLSSRSACGQRTQYMAAR